MRRAWFVHKYHHGRRVQVCRICESFDDLDRLLRRLREVHGTRGWNYEISDSELDPRARLVVEPLGIA